jgi:hypothetical protein
VNDAASVSKAKVGMRAEVTEQSWPELNVDEGMLVGLMSTNCVIRH